MAKGKFIVIDGIDGTGKATQAKLLVKSLRREGHSVETIDFPRYYDNFFGKFIGECLAGKYGNFLAVDSHIASIVYAADRWESKSKIKGWLNKGKIVIADRYVSASQIHQGGKIRDNQERLQFLRWLDKLEYGIFGIPRPDIVIYLNLPAFLSQELLRKKNKGLSNKKRYLKGSKDLAENDFKHLEDSRKAALKIIKKDNKWLKIECFKDGKLLSPDHVHELILDKVGSLMVE